MHIFGYDVISQNTSFSAEFLAVMSSSRSYVLTLFVRPFVRPFIHWKPYFCFLQNKAKELKNSPKPYQINFNL